MEQQTFFRWGTLLSLGGTLFAGYLTISKLMSDVCPFNEPCPYFLGYPACWYGLGLFSLLFGASLLGLTSKRNSTGIALFICGVSFIGILFAGSFVIREIIRAFEWGWPSYTLLLPTCAYGLIFYVILFVLARRVQKSPELNPVVPNV